MGPLDLLAQDIRELRDLLHDLHALSVKNATVLEQNTRDVAEHIKRTDLLQRDVEEHTNLIKVAKLLIKVAGGLAAAGGGATLHHFFRFFE